MGIDVSTVAPLSNGKAALTKRFENPLLFLVILSRTCNEPEVLSVTFVGVKVSAVTHLLNRESAVADGCEFPPLSFVTLSLASHEPIVMVILVVFVCVEVPSGAYLLDGDRHGTRAAGTIASLAANWYWKQPIWQILFRS